MIIRHKRFLDVCFETYAQGPKEEWLGMWVNMGYTYSWYVPTPMDAVFITDKEDWEVCTTPNVKCYRYGKWVPL